MNTILIIIGLLVIGMLIYWIVIGNKINKILYIVGNGFDIHHGVKSRYSDFKDYVQANGSDLYDTLEKYFNTDELWSDFEETLAYKTPFSVAR